jgi:hypothetical protein
MPWQKNTIFDANGNISTRNGTSITWTTYNNPHSINTTGESTTFDYGPSHRYWREHFT